MKTNLKKTVKFLVLGIAVIAISSAVAGEWKPAASSLQTRWDKDVSPEKSHPEYPRMQMRRADWLNLNGLWDYTVVGKDLSQPSIWEGQILVPFPVESALSGVLKRVGENDRLWYRRTFATPKGWGGKRVLLHFGAVDWETTVWVNGAEAGSHRGGYDGFTFDITDLLKSSGPQEIVLAVYDPTDAGSQPIGKQVREPRGIRYTPTSGIWQTVWLEPVSATHIEAIKITPDVDHGVVAVTLSITSPVTGMTAKVAVMDGNKEVAEGEVQSQITLNRATTNLTVTLPIKNSKLWSPDSPYLYDLKLTVAVGDKVVDGVESYFAMRKISLGRDTQGIQRLCLNNQPLFQFGLLDQGFWPDGLYTAPTDEALRFDIKFTKELGFNMARKHVKVEPDRWYYWCDKLGLLVWQDMPSGDASVKRGDSDLQRTPNSARQFETELKSMIDGRGNHPCIVMWVPFNEGWGQFDTSRIVDLVKNLDPTRLVNGASGWVDRGVGDVNDIHKYPGPGVPDPEQNRAAVLGEFGGLGLPVRGHSWQDEKNWGYRSFTDSEALTRAYLSLAERLHPLAGAPGLAAAVYTQTTDCEIEVNGLITYDRAVIKVDKAKIRAANRKLYTPPPPLLTQSVIPTAEEDRIRWYFSTETPTANWAQPEFNQATWKSGRAGFGVRDFPGGAVLTEWKTPEIWLRRAFQLPEGFKAPELVLRILHCQGAEVFINGKLAAKCDGSSADYVTQQLTEEARVALHPGENIIAVHCQQIKGKQFIDLGLLRVTSRQ
ncbi:MAG: sugar-binding domain-containing protein [Verrucomicrobiota bacterium]